MKLNRLCLAALTAGVMVGGAVPLHALPGC
jgi:hypothetical protein